MAELVLFHHAQGRTPGVLTLADRIRAGGHTVHTPDLYDGRTFDTLAEGIAHVQEVGMAALAERGVRAVDQLPEELVYAGISLGVVPAQRLAQTRPGARGAVLVSAALPATEFGDGWPAGVAVQVHGKESDPEFDNGWDLPAAQAVVETADDGELFLYPGAEHLFPDTSLPDHDAAATDLLVERVLTFLARR